MSARRLCSMCDHRLNLMLATRLVPSTCHCSPTTSEKLWARHSGTTAQTLLSASPSSRSTRTWRTCCSKQWRFAMQPRTGVCLDDMSWCIASAAACGHSLWPLFSPVTISKSTPCPVATKLSEHGQWRSSRGLRRFASWPGPQAAARPRCCKPCGSNPAGRWWTSRRWPVTKAASSDIWVSNHSPPPSTFGTSLHVSGRSLTPSALYFWKTRARESARSACPRQLINASGRRSWWCTWMCRSRCASIGRSLRMARTVPTP
mmetsp:Transcript_110107/g.350791  ORF Transcript_110107/g.350791 Transcript_110107/m.350791 type:complete len:260 (-) Transcript_110107:918-1697(-)